MKVLRITYKIRVTFDLHPDRFEDEDGNRLTKEGLEEFMRDKHPEDQLEEALECLDYSGPCALEQKLEWVEVQDETEEEASDVPF